ncbi:trigger factor [Aliidongia dinghuensis]|uniref:Trigger factor n=1 Tax=Aliidongia dinghuensis TaxID=1867774 RepID=A0A8J2YYD6_9PROT|nr:trigger factor [Aliidongia dinghuensis]GGF40713.1 trigger factor [Aliidongia dinghuensis]
MQITETSTEGLKRGFKVVVASQDIEKRVDARLAEVAKTVRLPGFRPGKVPTSVVKQRYGDSLLGEVLEQTVNETSSQALAERNLRPALQPKIEITSFEKGADLVYDMSLEILPEIQTMDFSTVALERLKPEIPNEELDEALTNLAERYRETEDVTDGSAAANGDVTVIDFVGSIDGEKFDGGAGTDFSLELGSGRFIPGFEEQLVGAKVGDHVAVKVPFPADYGVETLAGKDAVFEVDVKGLKRKLPAVVDEKLADTLGLENLEALRTAVREQMEREYAGVARQKLKRDLLDILSDKHDFAVPTGMVDLEFDSIWKQFEAERERSKAAGTYKEEEAKPEEETKDEYRKIAERRVRLGLVLAEVGRTNNIQVTQDEVNRAVMAQARNYPGQEKAVMDFYRNNPDAMGQLRAPIYEDKVVDFIVDLAQVTDKAVPPKELVALAGLDDEEETAEA